MQTPKTDVHYGNCTMAQMVEGKPAFPALALLHGITADATPREGQLQRAGREDHCTQCPQMVCVVELKTFHVGNNG